VFFPRTCAYPDKAEHQVTTYKQSSPVTSSQCEQLQSTKTSSRDAAASLENFMANSCSGYSPCKSQGRNSSSCSPVGSARSPTTSSQLMKQQLLMPQQAGISTAPHNTARRRSISPGATQMAQRLLPAGRAGRRSFQSDRTPTEAASGALPDCVRPAQRRPASSSDGTAQQQGDYASSWSSVMFGPHALGSSPRTSNSPMVPLQLPVDLSHTSTSHSSPAPASVTSVIPTHTPSVAAAWCGASCDLQHRGSSKPLWAGLPGRQGVYTDTPDPVSSSGPWCSDWTATDPCQGLVTEGAAAGDLGPAPQPCACQPLLSQQQLLLEQEQQLFLQQQQLLLLQQQQQQQQWAMPNSPPAAPALDTLLQLRGRLAAAKREATAAAAGGGGGAGLLEPSVDHNPCSIATARAARSCLSPVHALPQQQHPQQQQQFLGVGVPVVLPASTPLAGAASSSSGVLTGLASADLVIAGDASLTAAGQQGAFYGSSWTAGPSGRRVTSDLLPRAFTTSGSAGPLPSLQSGPLLLSQPRDLLGPSSPTPPLAGSVRAAATGSRRRVTISGDGSDMQVAAVAAALATDRLARLEDLRALQQQLMDEVITLLPLI